MIDNILVDTLKSKQDTLIKQDLFFNDILQIDNKDLYIIPIKVKNLELFKPLRNGDALARGGSLRVAPEYVSIEVANMQNSIAFCDNNFSMENVSNILFYNKNNGEYNYVFKNKTLIYRVDFRETYYSRPVIVNRQKYVLYQAAINDTDGDGRITINDNYNLFISDQFGKNLKSILPDSIIATKVLKNFDKNELYIFASVVPTNTKINKSDWDQITLTYSIETGILNYFIPQPVLQVAKNILYK